MSEDWIRAATRAKRGTRLWSGPKDRVANLSPRPGESIEVIPPGRAPSPAGGVKKGIAWLVLLFALALLVLPAIGAGWTLFYFSLSFYLWMALVGLAVVLVALAVLWALYTIIFR